MVPEEQRAATAQGLQLVIQITQMCMAFALSVWLLITGIGLVRRRPWARASAMGWSVAKVLLTLASTAAGLLYAQESVDQINDQMSQGGQEPLFTMTMQIMYIIFAVTVVWFLIWPIFLLLWFSRESIKSEIKVWDEEARAMI